MITSINIIQRTLDLIRINTAEQTCQPQKGQLREIWKWGNFSKIFLMITYLSIAGWNWGNFLTLSHSEASNWMGQLLESHSEWVRVGRSAAEFHAIIQRPSLTNQPYNELLIVAPVGAPQCTCLPLHSYTASKGSAHWLQEVSKCTFKLK